MKYIRPIIQFDVLIVYFLIHAVVIEFSPAEKVADRKKKNGLSYLSWEKWNIMLIYYFPWVCLLFEGYFPFVVTGILAIFVLILRAIEHIDSKIIN
jgi:hypothetical protein